MISQNSLTACFVAEMLGTFLLVFFGLGSVHVDVLTGDLQGLWQVGVVWGIAMMLAIYITGSISGAHINPAITLGLAVWRLFPGTRVPIYIAAQLTGAILASAILYVIFQPFLVAKQVHKQVVRGEPGSEITAMYYGEYFSNLGAFAGGDGRYVRSDHEAYNGRVSEFTACLAEFPGTLILALVVVAVTDPANPHGPKNLAPVFIGLMVSVLICVITPLTQACFNPARDFGPRMFGYFAGWREIAIPGLRGTNGSLDGLHSGSHRLCRDRNGFVFSRTSPGRRI